MNTGGYLLADSGSKPLSWDGVKRAVRCADTSSGLSPASRRSRAGAFQPIRLGIANLREKLGPFLCQLPPNLGFHPERLDPFLSVLPRDAGRFAPRRRVSLEPPPAECTCARSDERGTIALSKEDAVDEQRRELIQGGAAVGAAAALAGAATTATAQSGEVLFAH